MSYVYRNCCFHFATEESTEELSIPENVYTSNALKNDVILLNIFGFLNLRNYKHCRLVCRKWKAVGESSFKKKTRLFLSLLQVDESKDAIYVSPYRAPICLNSYFKELQGQHPIVALRLSGPVSFKKSELTHFFTSEGRFITDLVFSKLTLEDNVSHDDNKTEINLRSLLGDLIGNLKCLKIQETPIMYCEINNSLHFTISLKDLSRMEFIHLQGCGVLLSDQITLSPLKLTFEEVGFYRNNVFLENVRLNDFVSFGIMNSLVLTCSELPNPLRPSTIIELDLADRVSLKHLQLMSVNVINVNTSLWVSDYLWLHSTSFGKCNTLKIKKVKFAYDDLDLQYLPSSVEKLDICKNYFVNIPDINVSLPNIRSLTLNNEVIPLLLPSLAQSFNQLVKVMFSHYSGGLLNIDVNLIPKTVKKISFSGTQFDFTDGGVVTVVTLEKITLLNSSSEFALKVNKIFYTRRLVIKHFNPKNINDKILHQTESMALLDTHIPHITVWNYLDYYHDKHAQIFKQIVQNSSRHFIIESNGSKLFPVTEKHLLQIQRLCSEVYFIFIKPNTQGNETVEINGQRICF